MLQEMRKYAKSSVSSVFLGLLALSFGVWGIADIFHGSADTTVAAVGDTKIPEETYQREYQNYIRNAGEETGKQITPEEARAQGLPDQILQQLISRQAVDNVVGRLKLTASDDYVARQVKSIRAFAGPLGTFDHDTFVHAIQQSGFTEQSFIAAVRDDTARAQLLDATKNGMEMPTGYAQALFDYLNEERAVQYVEMPVASVTVPPPTDAQLAAYLKAHADKFSTPEYRAVTYVAMTPADVMNEVSVTDDQLKQEYEARKATYVIPEKRNVEQISFPDEASAKAARARIDAGASFADIAKDRKLKPADIALGAVVEDDLGKDRGPAAFGLPVNGVSQPVKGIFGFVLLHVTAITPGVSKSFDDVKADLRKDVMGELAAAKLTDVSNAFEDAQAGGANLSEAAKKVGAHAVSVAAVDVRGFAPDGTKAALPDEPELLAQIFKADVGDEGDPFQTKDGNMYVVRVDGVTPPKIKPLDQVRAEASAAYMDEQRAKALAARAKALADRSEQAANARQGRNRNRRDAAGKRHPHARNGRRSLHRRFDPEDFRRAARQCGLRRIGERRQLHHRARHRHRASAFDARQRSALQALHRGPQRPARQRHSELLLHGRARQGRRANQPADSRARLRRRRIVSEPMVIEPEFAAFARAYDAHRPQAVYARLIADLETPVSAFLKLGEGRDNAFLLESVQGGETRGRYSIICIKPDLIWRCRNGKAEINRNARADANVFVPDALADKPLDSLRALVNATKMELPASLPPMAAGLFGYLGYDMVRLIEKLGPPPPDPLDLPDAILIRPTITAIFDNVRDEITIVSPVWPEDGVDARAAYARASERVMDAIADLERPAPAPAPVPDDLPLNVPTQSNMSHAEYLDIVARAKEYIRAGDIFQVVPSQRFRRPFALPAFSLYRSLRRLNPSPFLYHLAFPGFSIVGSSPGNSRAAARRRGDDPPDCRNAQTRGDGRRRCGTRR